MELLDKTAYSSTQRCARVCATPCFQSRWQIFGWYWQKQYFHHLGHSWWL